MYDQYIPDLTERFPEGFDGVDLTDSYFPSRKMDPWELHDHFDYDDFPDDMQEEKPRQFEVGGEYTKVGFYGGVTTYIVKEIDEENKRILLGEVWYDLDGSGTRPAKWHELVTDEKGNEKALEWESQEFGKIWIEA